MNKATLLDMWASVQLIEARLDSILRHELMGLPPSSKSDIRSNCRVSLIEIIKVKNQIQSEIGQMK